MIKTINASVMPESVTGYHQRFEYDTKEGICHEYRLVLLSMFVLDHMISTTMQADILRSFGYVKESRNA